MTPDELETRCRTFAKTAFAFCAVMRDKPGGRQPANQLQAASSSVAANYRASRRGRSRSEFIAKLGLVLEEADETVSWLQYLEDVGLASGAQTATLLEEAMELRAIFAASCKTARQRHRSPITK